MCLVHLFISISRKYADTHSKTSYTPWHLGEMKGSRKADTHASFLIVHLCYFCFWRKSFYGGLHSSLPFKNGENSDFLDHSRLLLHTSISRFCVFVPSRVIVVRLLTSSYRSCNPLFLSLIFWFICFFSAFTPGSHFCLLLPTVLSSLGLQCLVPTHYCWLALQHSYKEGETQVFVLPERTLIAREKSLRIKPFLRNSF